MRGDYKRLGDYIRQVDKRNTDLSVDNLKGLSMTKEFRASTSNIIGTDMTKYKIVRQWHFACDFMSIIRVHAFPVVLNTQDEPVLVSPAYPVFKIIDHELLDPQYLMMWFRRKEFDRYADFKCDSAIRGGFDWEELCEVRLPIPSIEKQKQIVEQYKAVQNRIDLNNTLNAKLEQTAQALYKHWFVDFEFPNEQGKPYKSNGGAMIYNAEFDKEIPTGWEVKKYQDALSFVTGKLNSNQAVKDGKYPFFTCSAETFRTDTYSFDCEALLLAGNNASAIYPFKYFKGKFDVYQRTYVIRSNCSRVSIYQAYFEILSQLEGFKGVSSGTTTKFLTIKLLNSLELITPSLLICESFKCITKPIFEKKLIFEKQNQQLEKLKDILLSKMAVEEK